ncbi:hypothetical protein ABB37_05484 [Leptomonas pyrrhocoris]|uniref:(d)CMP kinase n=1 Tax=Leptomonas pyrrhocoris TaxID=157538 RepID=A0A0N0DV28_LEPPY|nr:hypothetical protein ABB37_05484 [Leptomonas pyrrhocoris]XP_015658161.1 hypothetical protein ABB37_05484 [Leptomonas pyrrhocoris]XP_015658162.1 hypothetical protein ABB37_05484 [Leptomonas pyrrhocoris]KPA79721.1 hypothetical protein ABB37_05484 [Leptomonas pyrrhocoris]KPA79722.1 hypothetical protein ABB37_05484 [Leptomonas pyrrhocoris]KPA79723.1 hypothetical protein ABB37_05484 [Leptomonas pyrrhocoris]|eukprot:XP_015658160.1 hypothetical protein ABB37_05484 [Leptomonas pyrrhocoris]
MQRLTLQILRQQDDVCSSCVLAALRNNATFQKLSESEGRGIVQRDNEDAGKLCDGIRIAIRKGILSGHPDVSPVTKINVVGLTANAVADKIVAALPSLAGNVIVLQGLSGTGKGTTVNKLQDALPKCVTWSNGNVFRSYTYLCNEVLAAQGKEITTENLTDDLLADVARRVSFVKCDDGTFQTMLDGTTRVADVQNTALKTPLISAKVPTVAQQTQGEVIRFGAAAIKLLSADGYNVILEGRSQTLDYIPSPLRFELVIPEIGLLGQRRAAQRVMAKALEMVSDNATDEEVQKAVEKAAEAL